MGQLVVHSPLRLAPIELTCCWRRAPRPPLGHLRDAQGMALATILDRLLVPTAAFRVRELVALKA